eukprot:m.23422 g.23422  ORF g.23422 m.23422 type:complete len:578 (-) comp7498_c0_seq1:60-1793(-)
MDDSEGEEHIRLDTLDSQLEEFRDTDYAERSKAFKRGGTDVVLSRQGRLILTLGSILLVTPFILLFMTQHLTSSFNILYVRHSISSDWYISPVFYLSVDIFLATILVWMAYFFDNRNGSEKKADFFRTFASYVFRFMASIFFLLTLVLGSFNYGNILFIPWSTWKNRKEVRVLILLWLLNLFFSFNLAMVRLFPKAFGKIQMLVVFIFMGMILIMQGGIYLCLMTLASKRLYHKEDDSQINLTAAMGGTLIAAGLCMIAISGWFNYMRYRIKRVAFKLLKHDAKMYSNEWNRYESDTVGINEVKVEFQKATRICKSKPKQPCVKLSEIYEIGNIINVLFKRKIRKWQNMVSSTSETNVATVEDKNDEPDDLKSPQRTIEKIKRLYFGDVTLISDVVRGCVICTSLSAVACILREIHDDPGVVICRGKNRFTKGSARETGGYRDIQLNLRFVNIPEDIVASACNFSKESLEAYVVELQIHLEDIYNLKTNFEKADSKTTSNNISTGISEKLLGNDDLTDQEMVMLAKGAFLETNSMKQCFMSPEDKKKAKLEREAMEKIVRSLSGHDRYKIKRYLLAE